MKPMSTEQLKAVMIWMFSQGRMDALAEHYNDHIEKGEKLPRQDIEEIISNMLKQLNITDDTNKLIISDKVILN